MHKSVLVVMLLGGLAVSTQARAHCQVPCGIYDDHARIHAMAEDVKTISKAISKLQALAGKTDAQSVNQQIRWTNAKDTHASAIITVVAEYFLTQKIKQAKASDKRAFKVYVARLVACHAVMRAAMKTKQTVDRAAADGLAKAVDALGALYPGK